MRLMTPEQIISLARTVDWFTVLDSIGVHLQEYGYEPETEIRVEACQRQVHALIKALREPPLLPGEGDTYQDASTGTTYRLISGEWIITEER